MPITSTLRRVEHIASTLRQHPNHTFIRLAVPHVRTFVSRSHLVVLTLLLDSSVQTHQQYPTDYSAYAQEPGQGFNADVYNATGHMAMPSSSAYTTPYDSNPAYGEPSQPSQAVYTMPNAAPERSYTLGGDSYAPATGATAENPYADDAYYARYSGTSHMTSPYSPLPTPSPSHLDTRVAPTSSIPSPVTATTPRGPRSPASPQPAASAEHPVYEDSPPMYDDATAQPPGQWGAKH